nr:MAG TPA: TIGR02452 family protein [Caudoviricetes sp.]
MRRGTEGKYEMTAFSSERLIFRPLCEEDLDFMLRLTENPDVVRYIPGMITDREMMHSWLKTLQPTDHEFLILLEGTAEPIGECSLTQHAEQDSCEIGYMLLPHFWNQSYGTEIVQALMHYAESSGISKITATTHAGNTVSVHLLRKLGFEKYTIGWMLFDGPGSLDDHQLDGYLYERKEGESMRQDKRARLAEIFRDTQDAYRTDATLNASVLKSMEGVKVYQADELPPMPCAADKAGAVTVTKARTFEAAMRLSRQNPRKKIAVLNFASATNPGGGVLHGSSAQEECLCRCSTLYPLLTMSWVRHAYYDVNRASSDVLHTDACIYTPEVTIFKTDTNFPERMLQRDWCMVDVISCAAPNLRNEPANQYNPEAGMAVSILSAELQRIHEQRARAILAVAAAHGADILVLGAFGCGAFHNDPMVVAKAYANVLKDCRRYFDLIEFAIFCRDFETENYDAFAEGLI